MLYSKADMDALLRCHKERTIARWFGACTDLQITLLACLKVEVASRRCAGIH
jgi:hypothetical protein